MQGRLPILESNLHLTFVCGHEQQARSCRRTMARNATVDDQIQEELLDVHQTIRPRSD